jgi:hypothetical protein
MSHKIRLLILFDHPEFDSELKSFDQGLRNELESTGKKVVYVKIERLRPKIISRIGGVSLDLHA